MFSFNKPTKPRSTAGVVADATGIAIVTLNLKNRDNPKLESIDYSQWPSDESKEASLSTKVKQHNLDKQPCNTVLPLGEYNILSIEIPDVPSNEIRAAIRWQIKDLIDFHIDDAVIDIFDMPSSGNAAQRQQTYVVASRRAVVQQYVDQLHTAKANLDVIDIPELALKNIASRLPEDANGTALIYLTQDRGLIILTHQSTLYFARTLNIGYEYLNQSETTEFGNSNYDQLVLEIQRSLDYYDRYFHQPAVSGIVIAPCQVEIPGLPAYLSETLGINARIFDIADIVETDQPLTLEQQANCITAIGAALRQQVVSL